MTSAVDGLVSGLSTSSLITQLMTVEAAPQTRLKAKVTTAQTAVASYQSVNSKLTAFKNAAFNLGSLSTWRGITATSSSPSVTATAVTGTNGAAGTTTFNVAALAKSQISTARVGGTDDIVDPDVTEIVVTVGPHDNSVDEDGNPTDKPTTVKLGTDHTAAGVAKAINAAGIGVKASVISTGNGSVLQLSGAKSGLANTFDVSGLSSSVELLTVATAQDARIQVGGGEAKSLDGGYDVTSSTNTFTGLMPGVTLSVTKLEDDVTVTADTNVTGIANKFQALVDAANATLNEISTQTAYNTSTNKGSPLTGDFSVRNMSQEILSFVSKGLTYDDPSSLTDPKDKIKFGSLAKFGIELDKDNPGRLKFDSTKFTEAYGDDPGKIQQAGIALTDQVQELVTKHTGNVTSVITGRNTEIDRINAQIDNWDIRLAAKKLALQTQYSNLEVSLGKLKNQSSWLSGQLAGLS